MFVIIVYVAPFATQLIIFNYFRVSPDIRSII